MSSRLPIGVATIERPLIILFIYYIFIFIISCTPVNLSKQAPKNTPENTVSEKPVINKNKIGEIEKEEHKENKDNKIIDNVVLDRTIIALFAEDDDEQKTKKFLNTF